MLGHRQVHRSCIRPCDQHAAISRCSRQRRASVLRCSLPTRHAISLGLRDKVDLWLSLDRNNSTRSDVEALLREAQADQGGGAQPTAATRSSAIHALEDMMCKRLEFGTAGLRGRMGAGFNRMNAVVVQQTAQGVCAYLQQECPQLLTSGGIVIGFDARHGSREFAAVTAAVFRSRGVPVHLFSEFVPTPLVAAGVAELRCAVGVMVTASHNPKADNGYKVYWGNGCQIIPPHDGAIAAAIEANLELWLLQHSDGVGALPGVSDPTAAVCDAYFGRLRQNLLYRPRVLNSAAQAVVYTPLHGVGLPFVLQAFREFGLRPPVVVAQQAAPDPEFPTVTFPNPEEGAGTWALAFQTARDAGARLVIANDPDADRLALAERDAAAPAGFRAFSGNEIGALLGHWMLTNYRRRNPRVPPARIAMLASAVSSKFLRAMADAEGCLFEETLTGFKWLGNRALQLEDVTQGGAAGGAGVSSPLHVLFAFEEAIGFMFGGMYKDKDGVAGAAMAAEMAAELYARGSSLSQHLSLLYSTYGHHATRSAYFIADRPEKSRAVFERLRRDGQYPQSLAGVPITWVRDLGVGLDTSRPDGRAVLPWKAGEMMITFGLQGGATLTLRASGTEPKLKYYIEAVSRDGAAATQLADRLAAAVAEELVQVHTAGLTLPQA